jgi:hypothetical protein
MASSSGTPSGPPATRSSILFALVALRQGDGAETVLAHARLSPCPANTDATSRQILAQLAAQPDRHRLKRSTYAQGAFVFSLLTANGVTFLAMSDAGAGRSLPFAFLEEIQASFVAQYGESHEDTIIGSLPAFSAYLTDRLTHYATAPDVDRVRDVQVGDDRAHDHVL